VRNITRDVIDVEVHVSDKELELGRFSDPALFVLVSLAGGEKHGYAMIEDIEETCGARPGPGTLYGAIARLERRRLVEPLATEERRRPYRLTAAGASALERRLWELEGLARAGLGRLATT
jgi:DNA-binding PadR family transcriptional regulator